MIFTFFTHFKFSYFFSSLFLFRKYYFYKNIYIIGFGLKTAPPTIRAWFGVFDGGRWALGPPEKYGQPSDKI